MREPVGSAHISRHVEPIRWSSRPGLHHPSISHIELALSIFISHLKVKPPERGVFALDHDGECKDAMKVYLACLQEKKGTHFDCRDLSGKYLECRMSKDLMSKEALDNLGLGELESGYVRKVSAPDKKREGEQL